MSSEPNLVSFGLDRLPQCKPLCDRLRHHEGRSARVGVLGHAASVDRDLRPILDVLDGMDVAPTVLFGPEHGFGGAAQDMASVDDATDAKGRRVISLYGDTLEALIPQPEHLRDLDVLLVDLVDVGSRYYTFVWTALIAARKAREVGVHTVILDRGNPLGGVRTAGREVASGFKSFVGWEPVPIRHGLTYGEMVALFMHEDGAELGPDGALSVLGVTGWDRASYADDWARHFVLPSPNMPTLDTAIVYPGGCLIEGTNLSEGRGHTRPFEFVGAPFVDGERLARDLHETGLSGFVARPVTFIPTFHKHGKEACGGVQIHVTDRHAFEPVGTYAALVAACHHQAPEAFAFRTERYEYVDDIPAFDLLTGSATAREMIEANESPAAVAAQVSPVHASWADRMRTAQELVRAASW